MLEQSPAEQDSAVVASIDVPCQACGQNFASRNLLFKHLRSGGPCSTALGWEKAGKTETEKIALLVGFLSSSFANPGATYVVHHGSSFAEPSAAEQSSELQTVEATLWKALDEVRGASVAGSGKDAYAGGAGPPKLTRAARTDKGVSAACTVLSFTTEKLRAGHSRERFVAEVNAALGNTREVEVLDRVSVRGDFHAKSSCDRRRYEALLPVEALLPAGRAVADRWRTCWQPPPAAGHVPWRLLAPPTLQGWELQLARPTAGEGGAEVFGWEGWEVRHGGAGAVMVECSAGAGVVLAGSTLVEWTQQQSLVAAGATRLRVALRVAGEWYCTVESFEAEGCEGGADAWGREHREIKLAAPLDRRRHPPVKQRSKAAPGERKKGRRGGRGGRSLREKLEARKAGGAGEEGGEDGGKEAARREASNAAAAEEEEEADGHEISGGEEEEDQEEEEERAGAGAGAGAEASEASLRLCDFFRLRQPAAGPPTVPEGAERVGLEAGAVLEGVGFLVEAEGAGSVTVRGLRVTARSEEAEAGAEGVGGQQGRPLAERDLTRVSLYRWLKGWLRKLGGRKRFHNLSEGVASSEPRALRSLRRLAVGGGRLIGGREYVVVSVTGAGFLFNQLRRMLGLLAAVAQGLVPDTAIDLALRPDVFLPVPAAPAALLSLAECGYDLYQMRARLALRPPRASPAHAALVRWQQRVYAAVAAECEAGEGEVQGWLAHGLAEGAERLAGAVAAVAVRERERAAAPGAGAAPREFRRALQLLREAERGGRWPRMSGARRELIEGEGQSFTMGAMPAPLRAPSANALFPELWEALRELEAALRPDRPPSSTVVVNRRAQFKPHKDSGAGSGQSLSLIVGLGEYAGGELVVEGAEHDVRYRALDFDGWQQRHWTRPFAGERFSVVWFTPRGCPPPPPQPPLPHALADVLPPIGWGSYQLKGEAAYAGAVAAVRAGYRLLDTASAYGNMAEIGEAVRDSGKRREELFITSKIAPAQHGYDGAVAAGLEALELLGTGYLDLLLVHWPGRAGGGDDAETARRVRADTWRGLEALVGQGRVRFIGVSNFTGRHVTELLADAAVPPAVLQAECHPLCQQRDLRALSAAAGLLFQAYSPLASPAGAPRLLSLPALAPAMARHGCSAAQAAIGWGRARCAGLVLQSRSETHLAENLAAPQLSDQDCAPIDALALQGPDTHYRWDPTAVP